jgi:hypothetical protein
LSAAAAAAAFFLSVLAGCSHLLCRLALLDECLQVSFARSTALLGIALLTSCCCWSCCGFAGALAFAIPARGVRIQVEQLLDICMFRVTMKQVLSCLHYKPEISRTMLPLHDVDDSTADSLFQRIA